MTTAIEIAKELAKGLRSERVGIEFWTMPVRSCTAGRWKVMVTLCEWARLAVKPPAFLGFTVTAEQRNAIERALKQTGLADRTEALMVIVRGNP